MVSITHYGVCQTKAQGPDEKCTALYFFYCVGRQRQRALSADDVGVCL